MTAHPIQLGRLLRARFLERPNRFLVRCQSPSRGTIEAFLPNPGRLAELFLPDAVLYLTQQGQSDTRRTEYTAVAVERDGEPVFLHTHLTNRVARFLIDEKRIPGLEDCRVVRAEIPVGHSRFDFLLQRGGDDLYMEVKSCTLFGNGVGMFPDAVTERGRRHLLELAALGTPRVRHIVLILVQSPRIRWFMPDYHTDLAFSEAFLKVRKQVDIVPVGIGWTRALRLMPDVRRVDVPWEHLQREVRDRGSYLLLLHLERDRTIDVGRLGARRFGKGHYVYVGSAMRNLSARVARHLRLRKKLRWHIDYLRQHADHVQALPIRSSRREECEVAEALSAILAPGPAGFGASDCNCPTHLLYSPSDPLSTRPFHDVLERFRMRHPT